MNLFGLVVLGWLVNRVDPLARGGSGRASDCLESFTSWARWTIDGFA